MNFKLKFADNPFLASVLQQFPKFQSKDLSNIFQIFDNYLFQLFTVRQPHQQILMIKYKISNCTFFVYFRWSDSKNMSQRRAQVYKWFIVKHLNLFNSTKTTWTKLQEYFFLRADRISNLFNTRKRVLNNNLLFDYYNFIFYINLKLLNLILTGKDLINALN